jgi:ribosomal protein L36
VTSVKKTEKGKKYIKRKKKVVLLLKKKEGNATLPVEKGPCR